VVHARALGKKNGTPKPSEVRIVMPLPARLQILDCLISNRISILLDAPAYSTPGFWVGAVPRSQPLDVVFARTQTCEKSLDDRSRGALSQWDVRAYYDTIDLVHVVRWFVAQPANLLDPAIAAAALRWQLPPQMNVHASICHFPVTNRSMGSLIKSCRMPCTDPCGMQHARGGPQDSLMEF